jgi:hypothetical protein
MGALLWARALSYERHPEYVRIYGDGPRKEAQAFGEDLALAKQLLSELEGLEGPVNVGGALYADGPRMLTDSADGTKNGGDF